MDVWVLRSQQWVNKTYRSHSQFNVVAEDGSTGWETMFALTRALQIELGIATLSDSFGPTTTARLTGRYGTIGTGFTQNKNVVAIVQCALWCKGYSGDALADPLGTAIGEVTAQVASSIAAIRSDMGIGSDPIVTPKVFKSLLNMDAYVTLPGGDTTFREIQRTLNGRYFERADFGIMPCDGVFSRDVQQGLMYALQYEIGMADGVANGNFGPGTQAGLREHGVFGEGSTDGARKLVSLYKAALFFNGFRPGSFDGRFDASTASATRDFESFALLPVIGGANYQTWASLLVSTGDPERLATACDTATPLTAGTAASVYDAGYRVVGRYLNGTSKGLQPGEFNIIFNQGLQVFPIYQEWNNLDEIRNASPEPGDSAGPYGFGVRQGRAAVLRARQLGFTAGTTIYFPIDADATDDEIQAVVLPYFRGVNDGVDTSALVPFVVGSYGPRNVCIQVHEAGLADTAFVSGMSTGWSANLGFRLPPNWAYDQIKEYATGAGDASISIDKNVQSGRAKPVGRSAVAATPVLIGDDGLARHDTAFHWPFTALSWRAEASGAHQLADLGPYYNDVVLYWLQERRYGDLEWQVFTPVFGHAGVELENSTPLARALTNTRSAFNHSQKGADGARESLIDAYDGDLEHFAATTRAYLRWGAVPVSNQETQVGDLGGWALDLVTCWREYVERGKPGSAFEWVRKRVGATSGDGNTFDKDDLVADVDAFVTAVALTNDPLRPVSDVMREVAVNTSADPQWRYKKFLDYRFETSPEIMKGAVRHLFRTHDLLLRIPVDLKNKFQEVPAGVELEEVVTAFTDVLFSRAGLAATRPLVVASPATGATVSSRTPSFRGSGEPGSNIVVRGSSRVVATASVGSDGTWLAHSVISLEPSHYVLWATQTVSGGGSDTVTLDFTVPSLVPVLVVSPLDYAPTSGTPTFTGTGQPGASIIVAGSVREVARTTVGADGRWSVRAAIVLTAGGYGLSVTQTSASGTSAASTTFTVLA